MFRVIVIACRHRASFLSFRAESSFFVSFPIICYYILQLKRTLLSLPPNKFREVKVLFFLETSVSERKS